MSSKSEIEYITKKLDKKYWIDDGDQKKSDEIYQIRYI